MVKKLQIQGLMLALVGAFLFSGKAVLAKLVYSSTQLKEIELLFVRMLIALPFYLVLWLIYFRKYKLAVHQKQMSAIPFQKWLQAIMAGILGYYVSSFLDFWGLQFISAGLERVVLFSYPVMVLLLSAILFHKKITTNQRNAFFCTYSGLVLAFIADFSSRPQNNIWLGTMLVFICAITFALYIIVSGHCIPFVGVGLFTATAMLSATIAIFVHFFITGFSVVPFVYLSPYVWFLVLLMGIFTTVVPSFLVSAGIQKVGSSNAAIISSAGPVFTMLLAWWQLNEQPGWLQLLGSSLVIVGVSILGRKTKSTSDQ